MAELFQISADSKKQIDHWLTKYPADKKQSALIPALLIVQEQNQGWLPNVAIEAVADYLELPHIVAFEAASFYDLYNLKPIGKHKIALCTNVACMLRGSDEILECFEKRLGIKAGETTKDGQFTLKKVECMAACTNAPMCQVDDKKYHENLTPEKVTALIDELMN